MSFDLIETQFSAGEAAVYVENDDEQALGQAMLTLLADPNRREQMGAIGRERVRSQLAWDYSKTVLVDFYDRLCATR